MGTEYKNSIINDLCKYLKIDNITSTAHHHQTLGTIERSHRTFNEYIRSYISVDKTDWDIWLQYFVYCFNTTPSVTHNYCPYELVFGKQHNLPKQLNSIDRIEPIYNIDDYAKEVKFRLETAYKRARLMLESNKAKQKELYDSKVLDFNLNIGDQVLLKNETGHMLEPVYIGPFEVIGMESNNNITVKNKKNKEQKVHKDRLKKFNN